MQQRERHIVNGQCKPGKKRRRRKKPKLHGGAARIIRELAAAHRGGAHHRVEEMVRQIIGGAHGGPKATERLFVDLVITKRSLLHALRYEAWMALAENASLEGLRRVVRHSRDEFGHAAFHLLCEKLTIPQLKVARRSFPRFRQEITSIIHMRQYRR